VINAVRWGIATLIEKMPNKTKTSTVHFEFILKACVRM